MQRKRKTIPLTELPKDFSEKLGFWASQYDPMIFLDSNGYTQQYSSFEKLIALGAVSTLTTGVEDAFQTFQKYVDQTPDYLFGYLGYDLKNDIEALSSQNFDGLNFPDLFFFQPLKIFIFHQTVLEVLYHPSCLDVWEDDVVSILSAKEKHFLASKEIEIEQRISKKTYLDKITSLKKYIRKGDTYEVNFCMEFYAENTDIKPYQVFKALNELSKMPFAAFLKNANRYVMSASPERFLRKESQKIIAQPIKGTIKRGLTSQEDLQYIKNLESSPKERAENIMVVDMVRNDLSKIALPNTVGVEELCQIYTFPAVHQMISTITAKVNPTISPVKILKQLFPMGSMTGTPKVSTMKIIEILEETKRGLYAGTIGYLTPSRDFDFNVVIRSMLYEQEKKYLSFSVGGAITHLSDPELEYEECLLKAEKMIQTLKTIRTLGSN